jgi:hypothetical protein
MAYKTCCDCGVDKPITDFTASKAGKHGVGSRCSPCRREYGLHYTYGVTSGDVSDIRKFQNNECAICSVEMDNPHVDHCHSTGEVRGLLCKHCNLALGHFKDNIDSVREAVKYLEEFQTPYLEVV